MQRDKIDAACNEVCGTRKYDDIFVLSIERYVLFARHNERQRVEED